MPLIAIVDGLLRNMMVCLQKNRIKQLNKQHYFPHTIGSRWESTTRFVH